MLSPPNFMLLSAQDKDALIVQLLARLEALERENAALREKLNLPPKTPDNSSTPPSLGRKGSEAASARPKSKPHAKFQGRPLLRGSKTRLLLYSPYGVGRSDEPSNFSFSGTFA